MQRARNVKGSTAAKTVSLGQPAPSCSIISDKELRRFQDIVDKSSTKAAEDEVRRREAIRQISEARVANWPNTIEAQRHRKEKARQDRLDREEERRLQIDEEERALREAQKAQAVQRANILLYEENDKVKNFTSKLFLATVLEEREKQLAIKEEKKIREKQNEMEWAITQEEALREAEEKEKVKKSTSAQRILSLKEAQLNQLEELRQQKIRERDQNRAEGRTIKQHAQEAVEEEVQLEQDRKINQQKMALRLEEANRDQIARKAKAAEEERLENEKIAFFAQQKEQQKLDRKARADEKFAAKLQRRQELIDTQARQLEELKAATEEKELKAMRDHDRERREKEAREQEKRERRQKEMEFFRSEQLAMKESKKAQQESEMLKMKEIWKQRADILIDEELHDRRQQRTQAERLQHFHLLQAQEKRQQSLLEKRADIEEGLQLQEAMKSEQEMYNAYVNSVMCEYVSKGRGSDLVRLAASRAKTKSA